MKALKFKLSGETAFFKKPDVNSVVYFTYGNIHKVALLGILGAILGLKGYNNQGDGRYPEFYDKLNSIRLAIEPMSKKGFLQKKIQTFNNSVGYASQEEGGNLIVKEQWLENPMWYIYILDDGSDIYNELKDRLLNNRYVYIPYLGKNDHMANINDMEEINVDQVSSYSKIDTLFIRDGYITISTFNPFSSEGNQEYKYEEKLPIALEEECNQYLFESFVYTNMKLDIKKENKVYKYMDKNIFFF